MCQCTLLSDIDKLHIYTVRRDEVLLQKLMAQHSSIGAAVAYLFQIAASASCKYNVVKLSLGCLTGYFQSTFFSASLGYLHYADYPRETCKSSG